MNPLFVMPSGRASLDMSSVRGMHKEDSEYGDPRRGVIEVHWITRGVARIPYSLQGDNERAIFEQDWEAITAAFKAIMDNREEILSRWARKPDAPSDDGEVA